MGSGNGHENLPDQGHSFCPRTIELHYPAILGAILRGSILRIISWGLARYWLGDYALGGAAVRVVVVDPSQSCPAMRLELTGLRHGKVLFFIPGRTQVGWVAKRFQEVARDSGDAFAGADLAHRD